jgi:protein O-mannosyl-transferase
MGERFLYTSSLGFCISIFFVLLKAAKKIEDKNIRNNVLYVVMGLIIAAYCFKTITRNEDWENNLTLFESGIITAPNSARAHEAYAYETGRRSLESHNPGERDSLFRLSMIHYNDALSIMPAYSEALYNKGYQNLAAGNLDSAQVALKNCLRADPNYTAALNDLGVVYFNQKLFRDGLTCFFNVLSTDINNSEALGNIGACYHNMGKLDSAVYYYRKALDINPGMDNIKANLVKAENELKNGSTKP